MASKSNKKVVQRGKQVNAYGLYSFLSFNCGARCLDDAEDLIAVVKKLRKKFLIYEKRSKS